MQAGRYRDIERRADFLPLQLKSFGQKKTTLEYSQAMKSATEKDALIFLRYIVWYICVNLIDFSTKLHFTEFEAKKLPARNQSIQLSS